MQEKLYCFSVNIANFLRTPILKNIYERLLYCSWRENALNKLKWMRLHSRFFPVNITKILRRAFSYRTHPVAVVDKLMFGISNLQIRGI